MRLDCAGERRPRCARPGEAGRAAGGVAGAARDWRLSPRRGGTGRRGLRADRSRRVDHHSRRRHPERGDARGSGCVDPGGWQAARGCGGRRRAPDARVGPRSCPLAPAPAPPVEPPPCRFALSVEASLPPPPPPPHDELSAPTIAPALPRPMAICPLWRPSLESARPAASRWEASIPVSEGGSGRGRAFLFALALGSRRP